MVCLLKYSYWKGGLDKTGDPLSPFNVLPTQPLMRLLEDMRRTGRATYYTR